MVYVRILYGVIFVFSGAHFNMLLGSSAAECARKILLAGAKSVSLV